MIRRLAAEGLGTAFLLMTVVGSGIMGQQLAEGNQAITLLANSISTGCMLATLILIFAPVSGAHFNPVVTLCMVIEGRICKRQAAAYILVQFICAVLGVIVAHIMFGEPVVSSSTKIRSGWPQLLSEFIATFGLLMVIFSCARQNITALPFAVAAYITAAYWFTASTSFANPAVTFARIFTDSFAGLRSEDALPYMMAQLLGGIVAVIFMRFVVLPVKKAV